MHRLMLAPPLDNVGYFVKKGDLLAHRYVALTPSRLLA